MAYSCMYIVYVSVCVHVFSLRVHMRVRSHINLFHLLTALYLCVMLYPLCLCVMMYPLRCDLEFEIPIWHSQSSSSTSWSSTFGCQGVEPLVCLSSVHSFNAPSRSHNPRPEIHRPFLSHGQVPFSGKVRTNLRGLQAIIKPCQTQFSKFSLLQ